MMPGPLLNQYYTSINNICITTVTVSTEEHGKRSICTHILFGYLGRYAVRHGHDNPASGSVAVMMNVEQSESGRDQLTTGYGPRSARGSRSRQRSRE